jgi:HD superfamily phosphohydrolase
LWLLTPCILYGTLVDTFYGLLDVQEPVLIELIDSPAFNRLKGVRQYGVAYYTTHPEEFTRYDHSLGVFAILRLQGASLETQIAGLLHDVSHTVFSHVGDWIFDKAHQAVDYQNTIHAWHLTQSGLGDILKRHGFTLEEVQPSAHPALECPLPDLCADRIDYNIQGAYHRGLITYEQAQALRDGLQFIEGKWVSADVEGMRRLARFSLLMTQECWGSPANDLTSRWLAEALKRAVSIGSLSLDEIHFGEDQAVWELLIHEEDPLIRQNMERLAHVEDYYSLVEPSKADYIVKSRFRGIDPWIAKGERLVRLTALDPVFREEYRGVQQTIDHGWPVCLHPLP